MQIELVRVQSKKEIFYKILTTFPESLKPPQDNPPT